MLSSEAHYLKHAGFEVEAAHCRKEPGQRALLRRRWNASGTARTNSGLVSRQSQQAEAYGSFKSGLFCPVVPFSCTAQPLQPPSRAHRMAHVLVDTIGDVLSPFLATSDVSIGAIGARATEPACSVRLWQPDPGRSPQSVACPPHSCQGFESAAQNP